MDKTDILIKKLREAGIKVRRGKKYPKRNAFSGIIRNSKKILKLNTYN